MQRVGLEMRIAKGSKTEENKESPRFPKRERNSMISRAVIFVTILGAAIGVPYVMSNMNTKSSDTGAIKNTLANFTGLGAPSDVGSTPSTGSRKGNAEIYPLADVLRSDITTEWVYSHWNRKSAGLADPGMFGIRVPLITGTSLGDLAGSLSYYFNSQSRLQRISLRGRTGDPTQIINLVVQRFGFRPQPPKIPGEQLYQVIHHEKVKSELRIRPEPVLLASSPHKSYSVVLELENPASNRYLAQAVFSATPPTEIAGIPIDPSQLTRPDPVPIAPFSLIAKTASESQEAASDSDVPTDQKTKAKAAEEKNSPEADKPPPRGLQQQFRWPG
jgi:hypothetical protein